MDGTITKTKGATSFVGAGAVNLYRLAVLISSLKLEQKGIRLSRGRSALSIAKQTTGLKTNNRDTQIAALDTMLEAQRAELTYIDQTEGVSS